MNATPTKTPRHPAALPTAEQRAAALAALDAYVSAAAKLADAWETLGAFSFLDESCAPDFVDFDEQVRDLIEWRDRAHALADKLED